MIDKRSPPLNKSRTQSSEQKEGSLLNQMIRLWMINKVNKSYQKIVTNWLQNLPKHNQYAQIQQEIRRMYSKQSYYIRVKERVRERWEGIEAISQMLMTLGRENKRQNIRRIIVSKICDYLDHVRKLTMIICEEVGAMFRNYQYEPEQDQGKKGAYYIGLFKCFGEDIKFLKDSSMSKYIPFSSDYDPLFLVPAKNLSRYYQEELLQYNQDVQGLFNVNISYLYRLMRAQQVMMGYVSLAKQAGVEQMAKNDIVGTEQPQASITIETQEVENHQVDTLHSEDFQHGSLVESRVQDKEKNQNKTQEQKVALKTVDQQEEQKLLHNKKDKRCSISQQMSFCYQSSKLPPIKKLKNQSNSLNDWLNDKRSFFHCEPIVINLKGSKKVSQKKQNQKGSQDEISGNEGNTMPQMLEDKVTQKRQIENVWEYPRVKNKIKTEPMKIVQDQDHQGSHKYSKEKLRSRQVPPIRIFSSRTAKKRTLSLDKQRFASPKNKIKVIDRSSQLPRITNKGSRATKMSRVYNGQDSSLEEDCLCRQKYKAHKKQEHNRMGDEDYEHKKKQIVRNVRSKYRQKAQRQINYEISKLGDGTFHKMRGVSFTKKGGQTGHYRQGKLRQSSQQI